MTLATEPMAWSKSQVAALRECRRKYFFQRGAPLVDDSSAGSVWADATRLKKLTNRHLWSGSIVHDSIGTLLKTLRQNMPLPSREALLQEVREKMRDQFKSSLKEPLAGKRLFEHEYGLRISSEIWQSHWSSVEKSLTRFLASPWLDRLTKLGPECWKTVDEVLSFDVGGIKAYVKIDCAIESNGGFYLIDWKTSRVRPSDEASLLVSALYAHEVWGADPGAITAVAVSLLDGRSHKAVVSEDTLMETYLKIQEEASLLESAASEGVLDPFSLPAASSLEICERCNFQKICHPQGLWR